MSKNKTISHLVYLSKLFYNVLSFSNDTFNKGTILNTDFFISCERLTCKLWVKQKHIFCDEMDRKKY